MVITTVILVRHAEKAGASGDVPLSPAGISPEIADSEYADLFVVTVVDGDAKY